MTPYSSSGVFFHSKLSTTETIVHVFQCSQTIPTFLPSLGGIQLTLQPLQFHAFLQQQEQHILTSDTITTGHANFSPALLPQTQTTKSYFVCARLGNTSLSKAISGCGEEKRPETKRFLTGANIQGVNERHQPAGYGASLSLTARINMPPYIVEFKLSDPYSAPVTTSQPSKETSLLAGTRRKSIRQ
jgi:hypothetical protein